jgi:hypothetical protein
MPDYLTDNEILRISEEMRESRDLLGMLHLLVVIQLAQNGVTGRYHITEELRLPEPIRPIPGDDLNSFGRPK